MARRIRALLAAEASLADVAVQGWVRTRRDSRGFSFLELNDGSCLANIQIIVDAGIEGYEELLSATTGAAVSVHGDLVESEGKGQRWEIRAKRLALVGPAAEDYPLQKKRHSDEFLREIAHLRPRSNKYGALFRLRSALGRAIHDFFHERGFVQVHTPVITGSDCEGAGEMFRVTTLDPDAPPRRDGNTDYSRDFFGKPAMLTVSGQLPLEAFCLSLGRVYTFGPTFRSENSNTSRHMAEFWMVEPEVAFADLADNMTLAEDFIRYLLRFVLVECSEDLGLFARFVDKSLMERLQNIADSEFIRLTYTEAVDLLCSSGRKFEYEPAWGRDLQSEHERYLTEEHFHKPVVVYDYPRDIKAFYMRCNDDGKTVAAMDILVPHIGEIIGGSQREERFEVLRERIRELGLNEDDYWWYLDLRRHGSAPHSGFGLGFERLLMLVTGVTNIRDTIPFPRTPKHLEF